MKQIRINWGELIRSSVKANIEEKRRNLAKALLLSERLRKKSAGEPPAEEIVRAFRESLYARSGG